MDRDLLRPPSVGTWLLLVLSVSIMTAGLMPGPLTSILAPVALFGCSAFAVGVIFRWLGRVAGFTARELVSGYQEGVAEARGRRADDVA